MYRSCRSPSCFRVDKGMERRADGNDNSSFSIDSSPSHNKVSSNSFRRQDDASKSPQPVDFGLWKLAPPVLGLFALGVYAGFKKQLRADLLDEQIMLKTGGQVKVNANRLAARALMYASAISVGCTSAGILATGYFMGVRNVQEFSAKMNKWAPEQLHKWGFRLPPGYAEQKEIINNMTQDEELEYFSCLIMKEEDQAAQVAARKKEEADRELERQKAERARETMKIVEEKAAARSRQQ